MVAEKSTPKKDKTLENDVLKEKETPILDEKKMAETTKNTSDKVKKSTKDSEKKEEKPKKKASIRAIFFTILLVFFGVVAGVPQIRMSIKHHVEHLINRGKILLEERNAVQKELDDFIEAEQKENQKDFENAQVIVATLGEDFNIEDTMALDEENDTPATVLSEQEEYASTAETFEESEEDFSLQPSYEHTPSSQEIRSQEALTFSEFALISEEISREFRALKHQNIAFEREIRRLKKTTSDLELQQARLIDALPASIPSVEMIEKRFLATVVRDNLLADELEQTNRKLKSLETNKADATRVLSLLTRIEEKEQKQSASNQEKDKALALLLALFQVREAMMQGLPFDVELKTASLLSVPNSEASVLIEALAPFARKGIFTKMALSQSYNTYANRAVLAEGRIDKTGIFYQALNSIKALVVIRKMETSDQDFSTQTILAHGQEAMNEGGFVLTLANLKALKGDAFEEMSPWIREVHVYLAATKNINEAISIVLRDVSLKEI